MHEIESELLQIIDSLDAIVERYVGGRISFDIFLQEYGYPYGEYALDGHESGETGRQVLSKLKGRLALHEQITELVLHKGIASGEPKSRGELSKIEAANLVLELASKFSATKT